MLTFQDLQAVKDTDKDRAEFVRKVISEHKSSELYRVAKTADEYDRCRNTTTMTHNKYITDVYGRKHIDKNAIVHRSCSGFYPVLSNQLNQYVLANGVKFEKPEAKKALGADFDNIIQEAGKHALDGAVSFTFFNLDHCEVFPVYDGTNKSEFAPLYHEITGELCAGVRSWRLDADKPLNATLYEPDGYTSFMWSDKKDYNPGAGWEFIGGDSWMQKKRSYTQTEIGDAKDRRDGTTEIVDGAPAAGFPIVPLWGDRRKQSYIVGLQEKIDAYDFVLNGWEDDLSLPQLYWIIQGAGGMDDSDLQEFLDRLYTIKAAAPAQDQSVTAVPVNLPVEARSALLAALRKQIFDDAQAFNPDDVKSGSTVVAQIEAAYEPLNQRANSYERQLDAYIRRLMKVAGVESEFTFSPDKITNKTELINAYMTIASILPRDYLLEKLADLLGDGDRLDEIKRMLDAEDAERLGGIETETEGKDGTREAVETV